MNAGPTELALVLLLFRIYMFVFYLSSLKSDCAPFCLSPEIKSWFCRHLFFSGCHKPFAIVMSLNSMAYLLRKNIDWG